MMIKKSLLLIVFSLLINWGYGQNTFKKYTEEKSGKVTAWAKGVVKAKENYYREVNLVDIYPYYEAGSYYLVMASYIMSDGYTSVVKEHGYGDIYLLLEYLDGEKVVQLHRTYREARQKDSHELLFKISSEQMIYIAISQSLNIKVRSTKILKYENYDYSFSWADLKGFREFAEGMKLIEKQ